MSYHNRPVVAVLGIIEHDRKILLVRRSNPPDAGFWGFPGGKIESGETIEFATVREVREETSLTVVPYLKLPPLEAFDLDASGLLRYHYILLPVKCRYVGGCLEAASDVFAARWFSYSDLDVRNGFFSDDVLALARQSLACGASASAVRCATDPT